jgi:hypothetical protein
MVRNAVATGEPVLVIILGTAHYLTEAVKSQAPGWAYIRVTTEAVRARLEESPEAK